jgi:hypothetical protein
MVNITALFTALLSFVAPHSLSCDNIDFHADAREILRETMEIESEENNRKRSLTRYWVIKNNNFYARFQYADAAGKAKEKYRPISDKRLARTVVEDMRRELSLLGEELFKGEKITFDQILDTYERGELTEAE